MDQIASILEQLRIFAVQHAPERIPTSAVPVAVILLGAGVMLSVLGAKFARFGLTSAFVVAGAVLGDRFAHAFDFDRIISVGVGAILIGLIGFQTFRLWVGVAVAALLSMLVVGGFGANRVTPYLKEYVDTSGPISGEVIPLGESEFSIPSVDEQTAYLNREPRTWFANFWAFMTERDLTLARNIQALAILSALGGLCLGLMAVRPSLIVTTSVIGTVMVVGGVGTLLAGSVPSASASLQNNPRLIGLGVAAFLATSLVLQSMLMRKSSLSGPKPVKG